MLRLLTSDTLVTTLRHLLLVCSLWGIPWLASVALSREVRASRKVAAVVVSVGVLMLFPHVGAATSVIWMLIGLCYYVGCSCVLHGHAGRLLKRRNGHLALFPLLVAVYLAVPALIFPSFASVTFLVFGWHLLLSTYSCVSEGERLGAPAGMREFLFFLFVNPVLVYSERGRRVTARGLGPLGRVGAGCALMGITSAILRPSYEMLRPESHTVVAFATMRVLAEYGAHSGLASVRIGLVGLRGWWVPECYRYPLLADSPLDFWRRWNTYFGSWLSRYVLVPLSRRMGTLAVGVKLPTALFLTFLASGAIHEIYTILANRDTSLRFMGFFLAAGGLASVGCALQRVAYQTEKLARNMPRIAGGLKSLRPLVARVSVLAFLATAAKVWG